jgi:predicted DNA binding CopG/RHH family protein
MAQMRCHSGVMDLRPYIESIHQQLAETAEAGGDEARALAERLAAPLDAAIRLALQDALGAAAAEITVELAPGSVELRLRGRNPEFVVTSAPVEQPVDDFSGASPASLGSADTDEGGTSRINLRMPEHLKTRVEEAASSEGLSVNTWLVRAASSTLDRAEAGGRRDGRASRGPGRFTGWVR